MRRLILAAAAATVFVVAGCGTRRPADLAATDGGPTPDWKIDWDAGLPFDGGDLDGDPVPDAYVPPDAPPIPDIAGRDITPAPDAYVRPDKGPAVDAPPTGNAVCRGATTLVLKGGKATVTGTTSGVANEFGTSINCRTRYIMRGGQRYYRVGLTAGKSYRVSVQAGYVGGQFYIFRTTCTAAAINADCGSLGKTGAVSGYVPTTGTGRLIFKPAASGTYTIAVDGASSFSSGGPFTLTVEEVTVPTNGTCKRAATVTLVKGKATVKGDTSVLTNEFGTAINCGSTFSTFAGPQAYYRVVLTAGKSYSVTLKPSFTGQFYIFGSTCTAPAINGDCSSGGKSGAVSGYAYATRPATLFFKPPKTASYTIAVDSRLSGSSYYRGPFQLDIAEVAVSGNATCKGATRVTLSKGKVTLKGSTSGVPNEFGTQIRCGGFPNAGGQVYYKLKLEKGRGYKFALSSSFSARVNVFRANCTPSAINADCNSGGKTGGTATSFLTRAGTVIVTPPATGDYIVSVDSFSTTYGGSFTLEISETKVATNTTCKAAKTITLGSGVTTITGDTRGAPNEFGTAINCGSTFYVFRGSQVYYRVNLKAGTTYTFTLAPSFYAGYLYIFGTTCDATAINKDCGSFGKTGILSAPAYSMRPATVTFKPSTSGAYTFAVDSASASSSYAGPFVVTIR